MANMQKYIEFIGNGTDGTNIACEPGAGLFSNFQFIKSNKKIGIGLIQDYIDNRTYVADDCVAIHGDALEFNKLIDGEVDVFLLLDFLEHLNKDDGLRLINRLKLHSSRILIFTPHGTFNQDGVAAYKFAKDDLYIKNASEAIEAQRHKSTWYVDDLESLGFNVELDNNWHPSVDDKEQFRDDGGAVMLAVWNK